MDNDVKNKILAVTGGANGIGYEITKHFLKAGVKNAIILDIDTEKGDKATKELNAEFGENRVEFIKCNVIKDLEEIYKKICNRYGKFDILVNCAGIYSEDPDKCIDINLKALIKWCFKFVELFGKDRNGNGGTIINIASKLAIQVTKDRSPVYQASKFGVLGFTKSLGHEEIYKDHGVRIMGICPGFTETNLTAWVSNYDGAKQRPEAVGECAVKVYQIGETASMWLIEGGKMEEVK